MRTIGCWLVCSVIGGLGITPATKADQIASASPAAAEKPPEVRGAAVTAETATSEGAEQETSWLLQMMKRVERHIDKGAGHVNAIFAAVLFYPIGSRHATVRRPADDIEESAVAAMVDQLASQGRDVDDADFELRVPAGVVTEEERLELQERLRARFCKGVYRTFSVSEAEATGESELVLRATWSGIPLAVLWLVMGAVFFTLRMKFINLRGFKHAILATMGKFSGPGDEGEVSHFQALCAALSATVGLGNIAGVAIAIMVGGPGATFWMIVAGLLGMSSKFTECTLGQKYREVRPDGRIMGGAMFYLSKGLGELNLAPLGRALAVLFAFMCIGGSFAGGNAFQVSQSLNAVQEILPLQGHPNVQRAVPWIYGLAMTVLVGIVIIGGIRRIAKTAEKIVPFMCGIYILACLFVILSHYQEIPAAMAAIIQGAFSPRAGLGGFVGVLTTGFQRAAFSNEAGIGSAAIAHSAARTPYPVREGIVALLEPFIDTVVVCTMTALVMVVTGAYEKETYLDLIVAKKGAALTSRAMGETLPWFPYILAVAVILFAYSTMISWSYYGERCWAWLFGDRSSMTYRVIFLVFVFLGAIITARNVLDFGDLMILGMAFPNILGVVLLSGRVKRLLDDYLARLRAGEFRVQA